MFVGVRFLFFLNKKGKTISIAKYYRDYLGNQNITNTFIYNFVTIMLLGYEISVICSKISGRIEASCI